MASKKATKATPKKAAKKPHATPTRRDWKEIFLDALRQSPNVSAAAKAAGHSRQHVYVARDEDAAFALAWDDALAEAVDMAEGEAYRRAVEGVEKPVYQGGIRVGEVQDYSDTLLIFLLKAHRPHLYREALDLNLRKPKSVEEMSDEELAAIAAGKPASGGAGTH